jgi:hypothetical protein
MKTIIKLPVYVVFVCTSFNAAQVAYPKFQISMSLLFNQAVVTAWFLRIAV